MSSVWVDWQPIGVRTGPPIARRTASCPSETAPEICWKWSKYINKSSGQLCDKSVDITSSVNGIVFMDSTHLLVITKKADYDRLRRKAIFWSLEKLTESNKQQQTTRSREHSPCLEETRVSVFRTWRVDWLSRENIAAAAAAAAAAGLIWSTFLQGGVGGWLEARRPFGALVLTSRTAPPARAGQTQAAGRPWKKTTSNTFTVWCRAGFQFPQSHIETVIPSLKLAFVS